MAEKRQTVGRPELLVNGSDEQFRQLIHDTLAFSSRIQEVRNGFATLVGLSGSQYTILVAIGQLQGKAGIGVNAVADRLHISGAFVTIEVNKLVAQGLVTKEPDAEDRRRVRLKVTGEGRARLDELKSVQAPVNDALFSSLTPKEFGVLCEVMSRLVVHGGEALALLEFFKTRSEAATRLQMAK